jgi:hypothetical protein
MVKKALGIVLLLLLAIAVGTLVYYNIQASNETAAENTKLADENGILVDENANLRSRIQALQDELTEYKTANLTAALGIVEIQASSVSELNWSNYLWVTGYISNVGKATASNVAMQVYAFDNTNNTLMNATCPIHSGVFDSSEKKNIVSQTFQVTSNEFTFGDILSQQKVIVRVGIYHEGSFPDTTTYKIIPIWTNPT